MSIEFQQRLAETHKYNEQFKQDNLTLNNNLQMQTSVNKSMQLQQATMSVEHHQQVSLLRADVRRFQTQNTNLIEQNHQHEKENKNLLKQISDLESKMKQTFGVELKGLWYDFKKCKQRKAYNKIQKQKHMVKNEVANLSKAEIRTTISNLQRSLYRKEKKINELETELKEVRKNIEKFEENWKVFDFVFPSSYQYFEAAGKLFFDVEVFFKIIISKFTSIELELPDQ